MAAAAGDRHHRGYADTTEFDGQLDDAVLLRKPFGINDLATAIEQAAQRHELAGKIISLRPRATA